MPVQPNLISVCSYNMDSTERRQHITTRDNPNRVNDYVITLNAPLTRTKRRVCLRYIPDKLVLDTQALDQYFTALLNDPAHPVEQIATYLLEDINNELVARWVQVRVSEGEHEEHLHTVVMEDRQPQWDNPHLLNRLEKI